MDNLDYIDQYFKGEKSGEEQQQFEKRILEDNSFAEEVAFYISSKAALKQNAAQEKKLRFRELYNEQKVVPLKNRSNIRMAWRYLAAACIISVAIILSLVLLNGKKSAPELADMYINQNLQTLSVKMTTDQDLLQRALQLYNTGKLPEALSKFDSILVINPRSAKAKEYAGIVSLRLARYDQSLKYFTLLESDTSLLSNWGSFYKAVTLMKRNAAGDKETAITLLQKVRDRELEGKEDADRWLRLLD